MGEGCAWRLRKEWLIKDLEIFFGVYDHNHSNCLFLRSGMWRGCFFLGNLLIGQLNLLSTFRWRATKEPRHYDVNLLQSGVCCLYYVLRGLKARRYRLVFEDDVGGSQLSVRMEENLRLEYPSKVGLIDEVEIGGCEVLVCKNPRNKSVIRERFC